MHFHLELKQIATHRRFLILDWLSELINSNLVVSFAGDRREGTSLAKTKGRLWTGPRDGQPTVIQAWSSHVGKEAGCWYNNNNNNWFLYSAFLVWDTSTTQSALQCIIPPGHWIQYQSCTQSAPSQLPGEHSGQAPLKGRTHATSSDKMMLESYRAPIYTPGWRAAMWIYKL